MKPLTDQEMEIEIGAMLRFGVTLAAVVVLVGAILYLRNAPAATADYAHFHAMPQRLRTVAGVLRGVSHLDSTSVIQLGILVLIATPVARVAFCVWGFARQRDRMYVRISSLVLLILIYSLVAGGR